MQSGISSAQNSTAIISVRVSGVEHGLPIAERFAYCVPDEESMSRKGHNISPAIDWSGAPSATKSYAILVVDTDVPTNFETANKRGRIIPADTPRKDFYHWILVDIPAGITHLPENTGPIGIAGQNDFGAGSKSQNGYDGPCPPWNDERLHHYHFRVYALDVASLNLKPPFTGRQAERAIRNHMLAMGETIGTYTLNRKKRRVAEHFFLSLI